MARFAGSSPHNPFIFETATFTLAVAGLTAYDTVTGAAFSFGTTDGIDVTGQQVPNARQSGVAPEPTNLLLLGLGLTAVGIPVYRKSRSAR